MSSQFTRREALKCGILAVMWSGRSVVGSQARTAWKAGVSREVITPDTPVWLAGYGSRRAPEGKLHELWMKALVLESADGARVVLITSDFQGVPRSGLHWRRCSAGTTAPAVCSPLFLRSSAP